MKRMGDKLIAWLGEELERRGWTQRELARRAGISQTAVSTVIAGTREAGWDFCKAIAAPLDRSPIELFQLAGLLSPNWIKEARKEYETDLAISELIDLVKTMSDEERLDVLRYARFRRSERGARGEDPLAT